MSRQRSAGEDVPADAAPTGDADGGAAGAADSAAEGGADGGADGGTGGETVPDDGPSGRRPRRRRALRILALATAVVTLVCGSGASYVYFHLQSNIKSAPLFTGDNRAAAVGVEKPDPLGRTPLNLLLIGSDTRATAVDAADGGDAGSGANADVEMLVHLSADRSNITVISIPRDTVTQLPSCAGEATAQITSSLQYGPACTAEAVHKLTGITVDDYAMVDFGGVVNISNALGGVNVCVSSNMYDVYSGLKLTAGTHTLEGKAALQFLRTRHAFGSGSDSSDRTSATHIFFTDMINKLKDSDTLSDPIAMYRIADAATKSLTVSPGLDSIPKLLNLVDDLNKVPTDRITFTTMQNVPYDGPNMAEWGEDVSEDTSQAPALFRSVINDQSLTPAAPAPSASATATASASASATATATSSPTAAPTPTPTTAPTAPPLSSITVTVRNGTSVSGRADAIAAELTGDGFNPATAGYPDTAAPATTTLDYGPGDAAQAQETAAILGLPSTALHRTDDSGLTLVVGGDWTSGDAFPHSTPSAAPLDTAAALSGTAPQTADQDNRCAVVGTQYTEPGHTPQSEFADNPDVPNSAP
ncbi:LCP family protein [Streptacidiphilus sp. PB12-B1b]|uniref:LCP family protein n=1 Tax=Streptacidiphilus sp. PB12-B1b TaxID=2705012 RepID=UPI0015FC6AA1|nr:LCP family protein [Streptacidiphilus sp. PB12-B1b]QMU79580.1 LCP family protein [Streptacidiphilus sp. PB12-B1b]